MDLSVILVNWNTRDLLRRCLESLRGALAGIEAEIVVVDNASADGSAAMVRDQFPQVRLIANSENRNYAAGSNQGLAAATGEHLLLLNPDTELTATAVRALLEFLQARPRAGAVAPLLAHPDGGAQASVRRFPTPALMARTVFGRALGRADADGYWIEPDPEGEPVVVDQPMASCFLVRATALREIGGFDEQFPLFFNDVDLCFRLRQAGWEIWYVPRVRVLHHGGASTRQARPRAIRESHRGLQRYFAKHHRREMNGVAFGGLMAGIWLAGIARAAMASLRGGQRQEETA